MAGEVTSDNSEWPYINPVQPRYSGNSNVINNRYELFELIGRGATSRIYRAMDQRLNRLVAVKLLREEYHEDQHLLARFRREAKSIAALSSENIVQVYDYGEYQDTYFIVMQFVDGINLKELLRRQGVFTPAQTLPVANQVLLALADAHAHDIIHRDVKPQNILVQASDGKVKLADFGVAHASDESSITTLGTIIGTVQYMAPEQINGSAVSPATDLYSMGAVLYELLTGRLPFEGENQMQIALQHLYDQPPSFSSLGVQVAPALEQVVQKALAKNPAARYGSAGEMQAALNQALANQSHPVPAPARLPTLEPPIAVRPDITRVHRQSIREQPDAGSNKMLFPLLLGGLVLVLGAAWLIFNLLSSPTVKSPTQGLLP